MQDYGLKAATTSPRSHLVTRAGYNGGWDEGEGPSEGTDASLFMTTLHPGHVALPEAIQMKAKRDKIGMARRFTDIPRFCYCSRFIEILDVDAIIHFYDRTMPQQLHFYDRTMQCFAEN